MTNAQVDNAVATINRVEAAMINAMSDAEYAAYMAIPSDERKAMLYAAYKLAN